MATGITRFMTRVQTNSHSDRRQYGQVTQKVRGSILEKIRIYGDESRFNNAITYGLLLLPSTLEEILVSGMSKLKVQFGLNATDAIHCREIFNQEARKKTPFKKFSDGDLFKFLVEISAAFYSAGGRSWVGILDSRATPDVLMFSDGQTSKVSIKEWNITDVKLRMLFAYHAALAPVTKMINHENFEVFVDGDHSKVTTLGGNRKIDTLRSVFPINHGNKKIFPTPVKKDKPQLLEMADVLAYVAAHAISSVRVSNSENYQRVFDNFQAGHSEVVFDGPGAAGGAYMSIRSSTFHEMVIGEYLRSF